MRQVVFSVIILWIASGNALAQNVMRMSVGETCVPCRKMIPQKCMLVQKDGKKEVELFYENIEGFTYVPGHRYELEVEFVERIPPAQDLSKYIYTLRKVISDVPVIVGSNQVQYQVEQLNGKDVSDIELFFSFDTTETSIFGKAACNAFNAQLKFNKKKNKVTIQKGVSTMMMCQEQMMKIENEFLTSITDKKFKVKVKDGRLHFIRKGQSVLVLNPMDSGVDIVEEMNATGGSGRPEKTAWNYFNQQVLKLIQLDGESITDSKASLRFDIETKSFTGSNGCNRISGSMVGIRDEVFFGDIISTKMACVDEQTMKIEKRFMEILTIKGLHVDFAERILNIYDSTGNLVMMFAVMENE